MFHHHLPEVFFHAGVRFALFAIVAVVPVNAGDDAVKTDFSAEVAFLNRFRIGRLTNREVLTAGAVEEDIYNLRR